MNQAEPIWSGDPDRAVVVVTGSQTPPDRGATESLIRQYVAAIQDVAGLPVRVQPLDVSDLRQGQAPFGPLTGAGAVFLTHSRPEDASRAQAVVDVPVVTDRDTTAIALTAVLLTTLTRAGQTPQSSRVVIAGASTMPLLCPLLMLAGVGDIITWNPRDAPAFPLRHVTVGVHVVIDLLGATAPFASDGGPAVIAAQDGDSQVALPGLLRAMVRVPDARLSVEVLFTCALALVMATRPDERLPLRPGRPLAVQLAEAATRALRRDRPGCGPKPAAR